ncbi:MAG: molybdopterin biosynthesis protein [Halolamina sp.]|uniref:molybdopterin biosynthesis protein n=1 Tax=Halolamina sp. TaxID=1940283 RepID=UPI002FC2EFDF
MSERKQFRDLATPAEAHEAIASLDLVPEAETVPLAEARGRILAERVDAELDVPGFDRASMDGYAVRAADTFGADEADPATLELVGTVHAGVEPEVVVGEGECAEISTGAVMPDGADAVVMVERTDEGVDDDAVEVRTSLAPADHVMPAGADIAAGQRALGPGTELTPREIGLLSALGQDEIPVRGKPTVGIVSTGDELVRPGGDLNSDAGQIYDVNSYTIAAGVEEAGGEARLYPHAGDDVAAMEDALTTAADECDLVLSSGSTSASAVDVVYEVIEDRGDLLLHGVSVKPGKPMLVGRLEDSAYVGLPGYPVSALTIFRTFVAPAVRSAAGVPEPRTATVEGTLAAEERYSEGRTRMMPVGLVEDEDGETLVYPVDKGSGATTSLVEADGVVEVDADTEYLAEGEHVRVTLFSPSVRTPAVLALGEDDPAFSRLLDRLNSSRFLPVGSREGLRRLRDGLPDVAVVAGPTRREVASVELSEWEREWGLVVPEGNPENVGGFGTLVDEELRLVNMDRATGLRASVDAELDRLAAARDAESAELSGAIDGFGFTLKAHESPARRVLAGDADAGVGLRSTAEKLGLGFVPVGTQTVRVRANPDRIEKAGVADLQAVLAGVEDVLAALPGFSA